MKSLSKATTPIVVCIGVIAITAAWWFPGDPLQIAPSAALHGPSWAHLCGTDSLGRDVLVRLVHGAQLSGFVALGAVALSTVVGVALGLLASWWGGWWDRLVSRSTDALFTIPDVILAMVLVSVFASGLLSLMLAIAIVYTPIMTRVTRARVQRLRQEPWCEAARSLGIPTRRILWRHILPNASGVIITQAVLNLAFAILAEAALSYLGVGVEPDAPSWGQMLREAKDHLDAWWLALFPGLAISASVLIINSLGLGGQPEGER